MKRPSMLVATSLYLAALAAASLDAGLRAAARQAPDAPPGVYTEAQQKRGEAVYVASCANCHGATLSGSASLTGDVPSLAGEDFRAAWAGKTAADLFDLIRTSMPQNSPGKLTPQEYADVLAFILSKNDFPAGPAELTADAGALKTIQIEGGRTPADVAPAPDRSVMDGVYAAAQSRRGAGVYDEACANCHAPTLAGKDVVPPLVGADFLDHWTGSTAADLFERIRTSMPQDRPGSLTAQQYADVIAYIFERNRFPAGAQELGGDAATLRTIRIETSKKPK